MNNKDFKIDIPDLIDAIFYEKNLEESKGIYTQVINYDELIKLVNKLAYRDDQFD